MARSRRGSERISRSSRSPPRMSVSEQGTPVSRKTRSWLSGRDGRTCFTSIGSSQSEAAATVPRSVEKPISTASSRQAVRASSPMLNSPCQPMAVAAALPIWELCAHTTALAPSPRRSRTCCSVSNMCRSRDAGVLDGVEVGLGAAVDVVEPVSEKVLQLVEERLIARPLMAGRDGAAIARRVGLPGAQAAIAAARLVCGLGIDLVEVAQDGIDRGVEAVDVEAAELGPALRRPMLVLGPQPLHEIAHLDVAPHPGREARERPLLARKRGVMAHIGVYAGGVRPVGFDRDDGEAVPLDEPAGDRGAGAVEFRAAVARLAEQHHLGVGEAVEYGAERLGIEDRRKRLAMAADGARRPARIRQRPARDEVVDRHSEASEAVASNVENATAFRAVPAIIARPGHDLDRPVDGRGPGAASSGTLSAYALYGSPSSYCRARPSLSVGSLQLGSAA